MPPIIKILVDICPLLVFYIAENYADIFVATGLLMIACAIAFTVSWSMTRKIAILPLLTLVFALVFGGFTLLFDDESFIKIEVTVTNALLGIFLLGGMVFDKSLLKMLFGEFAALNEEGWNKTTLRMGWFFIAIAFTNEIVWRSLDTDIWVKFRVFGILGLTFCFLASQIPMIMRHLEEETVDDSD
ncbi:MAG: septation protein IspZ [Hyphomicrobiales bacterium]|nr:septation protein IspZ [Hyphomicrobiales bacterium]